jgi:hypothetical protein
MKRQVIVVMAGLAFSFIFFFGSRAFAQDPTGVIWDVRISGPVKGSAIMEFMPDGSIAGGSIVGFAIVVPTRGRKFEATINYGAFNFTGEWWLDAKGRLSGFLENPAEESVRLDIPIFRGTVKNGKLRLKGESTNGRIKLSGVEAEDQDFNGDISGTWAAELTTIKDGVKERRIVFFDLTAIDLNLFRIDNASAADLCIAGLVMLSGKKGMSIVTEQFEEPNSSEENCEHIDFAEDEGLVGAAIGKLNKAQTKATLSGTQGTDLSTKLKWVLTKEAP